MQFTGFISDQAKKYHKGGGERKRRKREKKLVNKYE
jgi:hypothetical protein